MNTHNRGFTLIELLVVIAIIGLLASVILASLSSAREKGGDAAVRSNLRNMQNNTEMIVSENNGTYDAVCSNATTTAMLIAAAKAAGIETPTIGAGGDAYCFTNSTGWMAESKMRSGGAWCVDSNGATVPEPGIVAVDPTSPICP